MSERRGDNRERDDVRRSGSGVIPEALTKEKESVTVLSAVGEKNAGSFALPPRPPANPRMPGTPSRMRKAAPAASEDTYAERESAECEFTLENVHLSFIYTIFYGSKTVRRK